MTVTDDCDILYRYWQTKSAPGGLPAIRDFDPVIEVPRLVGNLMLLKRAGDEFRYQLVGSVIAKNVGYGLAGHTVESSVANPTLRRQWLDILGAAANGREPLLYEAELPPRVNARFVSLVLPLSDTGIAVTHLLVALFFEGYLAAPESVQNLTPLPLKRS